MSNELTLGTVHPTYRGLFDPTETNAEEIFNALVYNEAVQATEDGLIHGLIVKKGNILIRKTDISLSIISTWDSYPYFTLNDEGKINEVMTALGTPPQELQEDTQQ